MDDNENSPAVIRVSHSARLHPALSRFPRMDEEEMEHVSVDAQFYVRCEVCGFEERRGSSSSDNDATDSRQTKKSKRRKKAKPPACLGCGQRAKQVVVRHLLRDRGRCLDCGAAFDSLGGPWSLVRCEACGSLHLDIQETNFEPPFPVRFGERDNPAWFLAQVSSDRTHIWGDDGIEDAMRVKAEGDRWQAMPNTPSARFRLMLFAERLRHHGAYEDAMEQYLIANIEANLAQGYFRDTGWLPSAALALQLFETMIDIAPDAANRGLAQHSFAMAAFSVFAKFPEYIDSDFDGRTGLHWTAIERAQAAERTFQELSEGGMEGADVQVARIHWILGDLVRLGSRNDEDRRRAIAYFDEALGNEKLSRRFGFALRESRGMTLGELDEPQDDDLTRAVEDLSAALAAGGSDQAYASRWRVAFALSRLLRKYGDWREALPVFQRAGSLAWQQFQALGDEQRLTVQAEQFANVFEGLASFYAGIGWFDEALALVEITRCSAVRLYTMDAAQRERSVKADKAKLMESLWPVSLKDAGISSPFVGTPSAAHIDDILEELEIGADVLAVLGAHQGIATGILTLLVDEKIATALLCVLAVAPEEPDRPRWKVECAQWRLDPEQLAALATTRHLDAGPFRERLIGKLCSQGAEVLLEPVLELLRDSGISRLLVSLPGWMTGLPLEAFSDPDQQQPLLPGMGMAVGYLPSVRLGSDLLEHYQKVTSAHTGDQGTARPRTVLFIGYGGDDLDMANAEHEAVAAAWGTDFTYLPGSEANKKRVLEALRGEYDVIHIQAHGTFDDGSPLNSALHFASDLDDDSRRISAFDLLNEVRFARAPLVVLSACSSAMTAGWRTGTYHGLLGSLLRVGAVGLVGSRWPVGDGAAVQFMTSFYRALRKPDVLPEQALQSAAQQLRDEDMPREAWAAFGYFGVS
jgi:hypothetical protein